MLVWQLALRNGMVMKIDGPWLDPDGQPAKDAEGKPYPLKVGAIFFEPEATETLAGEEDEETEVETTPAHYLVFAKPDDQLAQTNETRVRRVFLSGNVLFSDEAWPASVANEYVEEEMKALFLSSGLFGPNGGQPQQGQPQQQQPTPTAT